MKLSTRLFTAHVSAYNRESSVRSFGFLQRWENINTLAYIIENN